MLTYDITSDSGVPKYLRLYSFIKEDILRGRLLPGSKLPSKRMLAEHLGVSVITVSTAYELLADEGYVISRERSGYFVCELDIRTESRLQSEPLLTLSSDPEQASVDSGGFRFSAMTKIMREVTTDYGAKLLEKPPHFGCAELRNAIAEYLLRYRGMVAQPDNIIIGSGSEYLYGTIVQLLGRERLYGLEDPSYEKIRQVYEANGAICEMLSLDSTGISAAALEHANADVLHVTPFHSYPTGITAPASKRFEYLSWAANRDAIIVEDDFDSEFSSGRFPQETVFSMDGDGRVIYINTFSHSLAPSMRTGYMILPDKLMQLYRERLGFYSCPVPVFDQIVLAKFISRGYFERHLNRVRRRMKKDEKKL